MREEPEEGSHCPSSGSDCSRQTPSCLAYSCKASNHEVTETYATVMLVWNILKLPLHLLSMTDSRNHV